MRIRELFDKDPGRLIEGVIKITDHDPRKVRVEMEEYVPTEEIKRDFRDLLDAFIESRRGSVTRVCGWISGFFGSGKSHFVKALGYLLANRPIQFNGHRVRATAYLCEKLGLSSYAPLLEKELRIQVYFIHMLDRDVAEDPSASFTRVIYRNYLVQKGLSPILWVAEVERYLQQRGLWERFQAWVRAERGRSWEEERRLHARRLLEEGIRVLDPLYSTEEEAKQFVEDAERSFRMDPATLVTRLIEEATSLHPRFGRVVLLLDEVTLYIGTEVDRLTELNRLAERVAEDGQGKVWLFATGQEALEEFIPRVAAEPQRFEWLKDRFPLRVRLTAENIDTVVKKRLLQKSADPAKQQALRRLYHTKDPGALARGVLLRNPTRYTDISTRLEEEAFVTAYPLLPYHVQLMQEVFAGLRGGTIAEEVRRRLSGRERTMLQIVQALLIGSKEQKGLADEPIGKLATFDRVYDAIEEELRLARSGQVEAITQTAQLGTQRGVEVIKVAKALFLLQHAGEWLPRTVENVAAVLYDELGKDPDHLVEGVKACLEALKDAKWVIEEEGKYRFLSEAEHSFEEMVARQVVTPPEQKQLVKEIWREALKELKRYNYRNLRSFDVALTVDDDEIAKEGHLKLVVSSPLKSGEPEHLTQVEVASLAHRETLYWVAEADEQFLRGVERVKAIEKVLTLPAYQPGRASPEAEAYLERQRRQAEELKTTGLPELLQKTLERGILFYRGQRVRLDGRRIFREVFNEKMKILADDLFTEFNLAPVKLERDEHIGAILPWQGGQLPAIYADLGLVDHQNRIRIEAPVTTRILEALRHRTQRPPEDRTGKALADHFEAPPFGWDPRIIRLGLAVLFKNGSIAVHLDGQDYDAPATPASHRAFTDARAFARAQFELAQEVSPQDRDRASRLLTQIFGVRGGNLLEEIEAALIQAVEARTTAARDLRIRAEERGLPIAGALRELEETFTAIYRETSRSRRILTFLGQAEVLERRVPLLAKLKTFDDQRGFEAYRRRRAFAVEVASPWVQENLQLKERLARLQQNLQAEDFLERWDAITTDYRALIGQYQATYAEAHRQRGEAVQRAIRQLEVHPAWDRLEPSRREELLRPINALACTGSGILTGEEIRCAQCRASLTNLRQALELIEARQAAIERQLDEIPLLEKAPVEGYEDRRTIRSPQDVDAMARTLKDTARQAAAQGKALDVTLKVEVTDGT